MRRSTTGCTSEEKSQPFCIRKMLQKYGKVFGKGEWESYAMTDLICLKGSETVWEKFESENRIPASPEDSEVIFGSLCYLLDVGKNATCDCDSSRKRAPELTFKASWMVGFFAQTFWELGTRKFGKNWWKQVSRKGRVEKMAKTTSQNKRIRFLVYGVHLYIGGAPKTLAAPLSLFVRGIMSKIIAKEQKAEKLVVKSWKRTGEKIRSWKGNNACH